MKEQGTRQARSAGNQQEFDRLVEQYRPELLLHCYRMLGSILDAEDMVQETLLRAWKNLGTYTEQGNFRAWLYKIATNTCLDALRRKKKRALIQPDIPRSSEPFPAHTPLNDNLWLEPFPDTLLAESLLPDHKQDPEALYSLRESVSLAFLTVLHKLSAQQRALLILRDVLGFKAREAAEILDISLTAANGALLRARNAVDDPNLTRSRKATKPELIDDFLQRYIDAWETKDISRLVPLLKEDVVMSMPPLPTWYYGLRQVSAFLTALPFTGEATDRWKALPIGVNRQPALAIYEQSKGQGRYNFFGIHVLTITSSGIERIDHFLAGEHNFLQAPINQPWFVYLNLPQSL